VRVLCLTHEHEGHSGLFGTSSASAATSFWSGTSRRAAAGVAEDFDALVVFGGSMHVDQEERHPWLTGQHDLLREALESGQPLIGVCLGGQLLARSAGAHVGPASRPEIGWFEIELTPAGKGRPRARRSTGALRGVPVAQLRVRVPTDGVLLAENPVCAQGFRVGETAWGVQFHPEVTREMLEAWRAKSEGSAPPFRSSRSSGGTRSAPARQRLLWLR
jgi:GMP synthase-like glutamine amidotransferase